MNRAFQNVPGYTEASRKQSAVRDAAWLEPAPVIAGIPCEPLTVRAFALLSEGGSPFVCGGPVFPEHVAQFLWVLSPHFCFDLRARDAFVERVASLDYEQARNEVSAYCETVFFDADENGGGMTREPVSSFMAVLVDTFGSEYGWMPDEVLALPMARVFQLLRAIRLRHDPKAPVANRLTDQVIADLYHLLNPPKEK